MIDAFRILKLGGYVAVAEVRALRLVGKSTHDYAGIERTRLDLGPSAPAIVWQAAFLAAGVRRWDLELDAIADPSPGASPTMHGEVQILSRLVEFVRLDRETCIGTCVGTCMGTCIGTCPPDAEACWRLARGNLKMAEFRARSNDAPFIACYLGDALWLCLKAAELLGCDDPSLLKAARAMATVKMTPNPKPKANPEPKSNATLEVLGALRETLEAAMGALAPMMPRPRSSPHPIMVGATGIDMCRVKCSSGALHAMASMLAESAGQVHRITEAWSTPIKYWDIIAEYFPGIKDVNTSSRWMCELAMSPLASKIETLTVNVGPFLPDLPRALPGFTGLRCLSLGSLKARPWHETVGDLRAPASLQNVKMGHVGGAWESMPLLEYLLRVCAYTKSVTIRDLHLTSCNKDNEAMVELLRRLPSNISLCIECVTMGKRCPADALKVVAARSPSLTTVHLIVDEDALSLDKAAAILKDAPKGLRAVKLLPAGLPLSEDFRAMMRDVMGPSLEVL